MSSDCRGPFPYSGKNGAPRERAQESVSHPDIFAAGDVASMTGRDLPKSGVYAVRQGPVLAENLRCHLAGRPLRQYRPQSSALYLVSTGKRHAVSARGAASFEGDWVWRWKDRIDRNFMAKFNHLPEMPAVASELPAGMVDKEAEVVVSSTAMRCGGCGAKVGADVLLTFPRIQGRGELEASGWNWAMSGSAEPARGSSAAAA